MQAQQSVLIVDQSEETREVLQTVLRRRGMQTFSASAADDGLQLAKTHHPDLIVLDLDIESTDGEDFSGRFAAQSADARTPMVILGTLRRPETSPPLGEFVSKPYHFRPLVRKIEELLQH